MNLQTNTANFTNSEGIIKEIIVTIPKDNIKTHLTALIPDTEKYRVVIQQTRMYVMACTILIQQI
ncbi:hypothetical protein [Staphylococcus lugdunensis]|uniref:hypothetical protein n=1 Tax=Staphylococcus lugdunensis TaxID=28035 RepID=UPI001F1F80AF|nr:hypothetical protein [Staphylococcus lugdunensis]